MRKSQIIPRFVHCKLKKSLRIQAFERKIVAEKSTLIFQ